MAEPDLRALREDVESHLAVPAFDTVVARGRHIRRRRVALAASGTAVLVALTAVGVGWPRDRDQSTDPIHRPAAPFHREGTRAVLAAPDALVDSDTSGVDGTGAMLAEVRVVARRVPGVERRCRDAGDRTVVRWAGPDGRSAAWLDRARAVQPLDAGFVVAAAREGCTSGAAAGGRTYLVDASGSPRPVAWRGDAEQVCAARPGDVRCRFDETTGRGWWRPDARLPERTVPVGAASAGTRWARSADSRRIFWSRDGVSWSSRSTRLPPGEIVSASAAGRWAVLAGPTSVEYTSDGGRSWRTRDLTAALRPLRRGDVDWTVTRSGVLLGVTQLVGRGDVLFRSTDAGWSRFVETGVRTDFGLIRPAVVGGTVYVVDGERWAVSADDGATWRRTPALPGPAGNQDPPP
jgi:hypothetical protein